MIYDEGGRQQRLRAIHVGSIFIFNLPDILLTPPSMIFSERRGGAAAAAGVARQSPGGADTIAIYYEGGRQQHRQAIHIGPIFLLIHSTIF